MLITFGFLLESEAGCYQLGIPNAGLVRKQLFAGRRQVLTLLKRGRFAEMNLDVCRVRVRVYVCVRVYCVGSIKCTPSCLLYGFLDIECCVYFSLFCCLSDFCRCTTGAGKEEARALFAAHSLRCSRHGRFRCIAAVSDHNRHMRPC